MFFFKNRGLFQTYVFRVMVVADTPVQALLYFLNNNNFANSGSKFCVFCSKMTYFNSPSLGVGNVLKVPWLGWVVETGFYDPLDAMGFYCLCCWGDCGARGAGISRVLHGPSAEADMREKAKGKKCHERWKITCVCLRCCLLSSMVNHYFSPPFGDCQFFSNHRTSANLR